MPFVYLTVVGAVGVVFTIVVVVVVVAVALLLFPPPSPPPPLTPLERSKAVVTVIIEVQTFQRTYDFLLCKT